MVIPSRGCKKKLTKYRLDLQPQPPKNKAIRVCATAVAGSAMTSMCSTVAVPTALSSASSSVSARTLSYPYSHSHLIRQASRSRPSTNLTTGTAIRTNQPLAPDKKPGQSQSQITITNGKSSTSSVDDKALFEVDRSVLSLYKVNDRLGKGAYGAVWNAEDRKTGRNVALKKIFDAFRNNTDAQRTYREIIFLREFGCHPNIIRLLNVHRAINNLDIYLTFPLLDSDLHKVIKQGTNLTDNAIRYIFYQILKAVKYLHSGEVIHRDLKPANILLDKHYNVKVADFGLARSVQGLTSENNFDTSETQMTEYVATRWYRPPEILLANKSYSKGVDMWGLGCILGEMLLRKAVFAGANTVEQIQIIVSTIPPPHPEEIQDLCWTSSNSAIVEDAASKRGVSLYELFEKNSCNPDAIDLAEKLLLFHPNQRIHVEEALSHIFVDKFRDESEEVSMPYIVSPPLDDNVQLHLKDYRSAIYDMLSSQRPRPKTTGASARSIISTPRTRDAVSREKRSEISQLHIPKVRPGVGRKSANSPLLIDGSGDHSNSNAFGHANNRLKAIKSSIAWVLNKNGDSEDYKATAAADQFHRHQYSEQHQRVHFDADRAGSGDHSEYFPQIQMRNLSPYNSSSYVQMPYGYNHSHSRPPTRTMEPIAEVEMDVSDNEYDEGLAKFCDRSVQIILNRCDAPPQSQSHALLHAHATQSEADLNRGCDRFGFTGAGVRKFDDPYYDEKDVRVRVMPATRVENGRNRRTNGAGTGKAPHQMFQPQSVVNNVRRLTIPLTRLPVSKSKEKVNSSNKDLGLTQNLKETTADWYFQGIHGGRQTNKKAVPQKHFSQARLPPKLPSRSMTSFHVTTPDENRPRIQHQHSSYFSDKDKYQNSKRSCLGLPPPKQQIIGEMKHRRVFDSYTQTHGTISASELCELKNFSLDSKK